MPSALKSISFVSTAPATLELNTSSYRVIFTVIGVLKPYLQLAWPIYVNSNQNLKTNKRGTRNFDQLLNLRAPSVTNLLNTKMLSVS